MCVGQEARREIVGTSGQTSDVMCRTSATKRVPVFAVAQIVRGSPGRIRRTENATHPHLQQVDIGHDRPRRSGALALPVSVQGDLLDDLGDGDGALDTDDIPAMVAALLAG